MEERQVTLGDTSFRLPEPFLVLATQNPLEHHGTYPLAEAQIDRFMMHLLLGYPQESEEKEILRLAMGPEKEASDPPLPKHDLLRAYDAIGRVHVDSRIQDYIVEIVRATRDPADAGLASVEPLLSSGASPRAAIHLQDASRASAFASGRKHVLPEDVKRLAPDVLRHRLILTIEAQAEGVEADTILDRILSFIPVP